MCSAIASIFSCWNSCNSMTHRRAGDEQTKQQLGLPVYPALSLPQLAVTCPSPWSKVGGFIYAVACFDMQLNHYKYNNANRGQIQGRTVQEIAAVWVSLYYMHRNISFLHSSSETIFCCFAFDPWRDERFGVVSDLDFISSRKERCGQVISLCVNVFQSVKRRMLWSRMNIIFFYNR